eukprot:4140926-Pleurochrysis_carterae.AAC.1
MARPRPRLPSSCAARAYARERAGGGSACVRTRVDACMRVANACVARRRTPLHACTWVRRGVSPGSRECRCLRMGAALSIASAGS